MPDVLSMNTVEVGAGLLEAPEHAADERQERFAHRGEGRTARAAVKQLDLVASLDLLDLIGHRGLADAKPARGFAETAVEGYGEECSGLRRSHRFQSVMASSGS